MSKWRQHSRTALAWLVVLVTGWRAINYFSTNSLGRWDSGVFASAGFFITQGLVPYRDFFDHKPPVIFYLNAVGLAVSGGETVGIRWVERSFALLGGVCLFWLLRRVSRDLVGPLVGTLSYYFLLYHPDLLWGGNQTTEYGAAFTLAGALMWHLSGDRCSTRRTNLLAWGGGVALGLACLTKEPFLLTGVALCPLLLRQTGRTAPVFSWRIACGAAGALTPLLVLVAYFGALSALGPWQDVIRYNFAYLDLTSGGMAIIDRCILMGRYVAGLVGKLSTGLSWLLGVGFVLGVIATIRLRSIELLTWLLSCIAALVAVCLSTRGFHHYYLQAVPALATTAMVAVSGLQAGLARFAKPHRANWIVLSMLALWLFLDRASLRHWLDRLAEPSGAPAELAVSESVKRLTTPRDKIWCPSPTEPHTQVYAEARRLSPSRYFYALLSTFLPYGGHEQEAQLLTDLMRDPPRLIIIRNPKADLAMLKEIGIPQWVEKNYERVSGEATLWQRR